MKKKALKDLILILLLGILIYLIASHLDLFEQFIHWSSEHEKFQIDEILITVAISSILWVFFSLRRCRELHIENSKRVDAEFKLRESNDTLEQQVSRRTEELVNMNTQLQSTVDALKLTKQEKSSLEQQVVQSQKLESIGVLTSGIAHDFNNLLTAINGYADLIMVKTAGYRKDIHDDLDRIRSAGQKASGLTRQLLAFSRKQVFHLKILDPNVLVEDLVNMASRMIGENIQLLLNLSPKTCRINADKVQIEQVLMNLVINARDAMPGGGDLTISTTNATLDVEYASRHKGVIPGEYVLISVSDNGHGIPPDIQDKIFDPFFTTKESGKGTGLGLATVYGIVKQHKGNIWMYSEKDLGTTFKVYLPATDHECSENVAQHGEQHVRGEERILVVDDDEGVRSFIQDTLEYYDYSAVAASSGIEALQAIESSEVPFDLMLTDVIMPGMNGWELCEAVREKDPAFKVIFMSGYNDKKIPMDRIEADPGLSFVSKPLTTSFLIKELRKMLDA